MLSLKQNWSTLSQIRSPPIFMIGRPIHKMYFFVFFQNCYSSVLWSKSIKTHDFFKMLTFLEKTTIWWALGIEITFFRKFENYDLRLKSGIKNQNKLMEIRFGWAPSTVSTFFRKSWFLLRRQMPTVFSIRKNGFYNDSKSFLCKSKNLRLRTACTKTH